MNKTEQKKRMFSDADETTIYESLLFAIGIFDLIYLSCESDIDTMDSESFMVIANEACGRLKAAREIFNKARA